MTRKHFETIAISLGSSMREYQADTTGWIAILDAARTLAAELRAINPRFDTYRFLEYVLDVAEGRRDLDGKKAA
jgi:hypothetical protein